MTLRSKDLRSVLAFVADAHDVDAAVPLTTELLDRLVELVGCEYATYIEFDWRQRVVTAYVPCSNELPLGAYSQDFPDGFWSSEATDPRLTPEKSSFDKWSDRLDRDERERLRDEEEWNAEFRVVDGIGFGVGDVRTRSAWLAFDSQARDFDECDRALALALWPHVAAFYRRSVSRRQTAELLAALQTDGGAVVLYEPGGRIDHVTVEAQRLLAEWFSSRNGHLPVELQEWLALARPADRYVCRRNGAVLTVEAAGEFALIFRERADDPRVTRREREILGLVAEGLTNAQIARRLWVAPSTVAKHLEQVYEKLGVHSRTAAVAKVRQL